MVLGIIIMCSDAVAKVVLKEQTCRVVILMLGMGLFSVVIMMGHSCST